MSLTLNDEECRVLEQALDNYLPQLRMERAGAEARDVQHALSLLESSLEALRRRLEREGAVASP